MCVSTVTNVSIVETLLYLLIIIGNDEAINSRKCWFTMICINPHLMQNLEVVQVSYIQLFIHCKYQHWVAHLDSSDQIYFLSSLFYSFILTTLDHETSIQSWQKAPELDEHHTRSSSQKQS